MKLQTSEDDSLLALSNESSQELPCLRVPNSNIAAGKHVFLAFKLHWDRRRRRGKQSFIVAKGARRERVSGRVSDDE